MTKWIFPLLLSLSTYVYGQGTKLPPFVLGLVDTLPSNALQEKRVLNIYLPEGYSPDSAARYPIIYLLDGSAHEDFIHVVGLVQFCNFSWVDLLPKSIVVGIANVDRRRDFTFPTTVQKDKMDYPTTGGAEKFIAFLENELQPHIRAHYQTNGSNMLIGQSLGGLLATEILFKKPHLFSQYLIVSPSLWWDNESLLRQKPTPSTQALKVFVAVGKEGKAMKKANKKLVGLLNAANQGRPPVRFKFMKDKNHGNILHEAVYEGFEAFSKQ